MAAPISPEQWMASKSSGTPVLNQDFGAPGSTSTDVKEGTTTPESVAVKTPNGAKTATRAPMSPEEWLAANKKTTAADVPGTPKQPQGDTRPNVGIDTLPTGLKEAAGGAEALATTVWGMVSMVAGAGAGVATGIWNLSSKQGEEVAAKVMDKLSIEPKSKIGQDYAEKIGTFLMESGAMALMPGMTPEFPAVGPKSVAYLKERGVDSLKKMTTDSVTKDQIPVEDPAVAKTVEDWGKANSDSPKLTQTAIRDKTTGVIEPMGPSHDVTRKADTVDTHDQGFIDEKGAFLTRTEAHARAIQTKQLSTEHKLDLPEEGLHSGDLRAAGDLNFQLPDSFETRKTNILDTQRNLNINRLNVEDLEDQILGGKPWLQEQLDAAKEKQSSLQATHDKLLKEHDNVVDKAISENTGKGTLTSSIFHDIAFGRNTIGDVLTRLKDLGFGASKHQGYGILIHQFADSELVKSTTFKLSKERVDTGDGKGQIYLGSYDQSTHTAIVGKDGGMETFLHEASHAATHAALEDPRFIEEATEFKRLYKIYKDQEEASLKEGRTEREAAVIEYGFKDVHEFLAESINSKTFQKHLNTLQTVGKGDSKVTTVWKAFVKNVADTLGIKSDAGRTALHDVIEAGAALIEKTKLDSINRGDYFPHEEEVGLLDRYKEVHNKIDTLQSKLEEVKRLRNNAIEVQDKENTAKYNSLYKQTYHLYQKAHAELNDLPKLGGDYSDSLEGQTQRFSDLQTEDTLKKAKDKPSASQGQASPAKDFTQSLDLTKEEQADPKIHEFISLIKKTKEAEKESDPSTWTPKERAAYDSGDWKNFSKQRGYTEQEIKDYERFVSLSKEIDKKYATKDSPDYSFSLVHAFDEFQQGTPLKRISASQKQASPTPRYTSTELLDLSKQEFEKARQVKTTDEEVAMKIASNARGLADHAKMLKELEEAENRPNNTPEKKARLQEIRQDYFERAKEYVDKVKNQQSGSRQGQASPSKPETEIPHPASVTTEEDFQNKGRDILARFGPDAAKKFAKDVAEYRKKQDVPVPKDAKEASDSFYNLTTMGTADSTEAMNAIQEMDRIGVDSALREKFYNFIEGSGKLSADDKEVFDKTVGKYQKEIKALYDRQLNLGRAPTHNLSPEFMPRVRIFKPGSIKDWWERMTRQEGAFAEKIVKDPSIMQERNLFVIESINGKRTLVQKLGDKVISWKDGKPSGFFNKDKKFVGKEIRVSEREFKEATVDEIHAHTPYRFTKDAAQVLLIKLNELREFDRANNFIESWKKSPEFKNVGTNDIANAPNDWIVPKNVERLPQFMGYVFHPKTAYVIEDFAKAWNNGMYLRLTSALIKNMMLNPLPHMFNEAMHVFAARGLTGWINPMRLNTFRKTGFHAMGDVWNQSALYVEVQREGGAMMSPDLRANTFHDKMMESAAKEAFPELKDMAKRAGMSPLNLYNGISKAMQKAMWMTRDAMYLQLIREAKLRNPKMTTKEAIHKVDAHMPNYRLPSEVAGSRKLSEMLSNPNISVFSRYHYGVVNSMANVIKDMNPRNLASVEGRAKFAQGLDSAAAYAIGMTVLYPMMDEIDQKLFGDSSMRQRRAGPFHIIDAIWNVSKGQADFKALLSPIFTFNPVLQAGVDIALNEKIPYSTRKVFHQDDPMGHIAKDVGSFAFHAIPQAGAIMDTSEVQKGFMAKQMDIKSQSTVAQKRAHRAVLIKERQLKQRLRKYESQ